MPWLKYQEVALFANSCSSNPYLPTQLSSQLNTLPGTSQPVPADHMEQMLAMKAARHKIMHKLNSKHDETSYDLKIVQVSSVKSVDDNIVSQYEKGGHDCWPLCITICYNLTTLLVWFSI